MKGIGLTVPERRNGAYGKITGAYRYPAGDQHRGESLAAKLMQIEKEVEAYEAAKAAHDSKTKKGWRR